MKKIYLFLVVTLLGFILVGCSYKKVTSSTAVLDILENIEISDKLPTIKINNELDSVYDFTYDGYTYNNKGSFKSSVSYQSNRSTEEDKLVVISDMSSKAKMISIQDDKEEVLPSNNTMKYYYNKGKSKFYNKYHTKLFPDNIIKGDIYDSFELKKQSFRDYEEELIFRLLVAYNYNPDAFTVSSKGKKSKINFEQTSDIGEETIISLIESYGAVMSNGGSYDESKAKESFKLVAEVDNKKLKKVSIEFNAFHNKQNEFKFKQVVKLGSRLGSKPIIFGSDQIEYRNYDNSLRLFVSSGIN